MEDRHEEDFLDIALDKLKTLSEDRFVALAAFGVFCYTAYRFWIAYLPHSRQKRELDNEHKVRMAKIENRKARKRKK